MDTNIATQIISSIVNAVKGFVEGLTSSVVTGFQNIFMNATTSEGVTTYSGLNPLGIFLMVFLGLAIGVGIISFITHLVRGNTGA